MLEISTLKKILLIILTAIVLLGCINKPKPVKHAYRITDVPQEVIIAIAKDAVAQMSVLFPSTKTQIRFTHVASDQFGLAFIDGLRTQGFSVKEHAPAQTLDQVLADHQEQQKHLNEDANKATVYKNGDRLVIGLTKNHSRKKINIESIRLHNTQHAYQG